VADQLAGEMRAVLRAGGAAVAAVAAAPPGTPVPSAPATAPAGTRVDAAGLLAALGGRANVRAVEAAAGRIRVTLGEIRIDPDAIRALGLRGLAQPAPGVAHVITGPGADALAAAVEQLLK
jgi:PTS system N-acetylglucosamine-specific IIC component